MPPKKRVTAEPADLAAAIGDTKRDVWRSFVARASDEELGAALDGVTWSQPRAYEPGSFAANALFSGRGKAKAALLERLIAALAAARGPAAVSLRERVTSLSLEGDATAPLDLGPLAAFPSLRWVRVKSASALPGIDALRSVSRLDIHGVGDLDLTPLEGARFDEVMLAGSRFRGPVPRAATLRLVGVEGPITADADTLGVMASDDAIALGPIDGTTRELSVYNSSSVRTLELGALPALRALHVSCLPELRALSGAAACPSLRSVRLYMPGLTELPALPDALEELYLDPMDIEDASPLARLVHLRKLAVTCSNEVRGLPAAIAQMADLEHLTLRRTPFDAVLPVLARLPALRSLTLSAYPLERVPNLDVLAPTVEILSLEDCRGGFLEHDALARMPALREVRLAGSTLDMNKKQVDPNLRKRGVAVRFDR